MFCKNCGKEIKEDASFCPYCGTKLTEDTNTGYYRSVKEDNSNTNNNEPFDKDFLYGTKSKGSSATKIILIIVGVALAIYLLRAALAYVVVKKYFGFIGNIITEVENNESKEVDLSVSQDLPLTVTDATYGYKSTLEIEDVEAEIESSYTDTASVNLTVKIKLVNKSKSAYDSDYYHVKYKVKDEEGTVVENGEIMTNIVDEGDTVEEEQYISSLDTDESYTIEFVVNNK